MKVCHVTTAHGRYDDRIFQKECCSLAKEHEVHLLVNDNLCDEIINDVHIHSMKLVFNNRFKRIFSSQYFLNCALDIDADLYHLHDPELLLIAKKLLKHGKRVLFDSHEYYYEQIKVKEYIPFMFRSLLAFLYQAYETYICKRIDAVISICPLRNDNYVYNPFENRCKMHCYIENYPIYRNIENTMNKKKEFIVCYAGGLTYERGITYLIDACYMAGCKLILAGTFSSEDYYNELKSKESYKCVEYRGQCTPEQVFDMYSEASIGASTLLDYGQYFKIETFPVKVYEYFQMKLPVLISSYPYALEMNNKYKFGVCVNPTNVKEIANGIKYLMDNKFEARQLGNNGYQLYNSLLNWKESEKRLLELYNTVLSEK